MSTAPYKPKRTYPLLILVKSIEPYKALPTLESFLKNYKLLGIGGY